MASEAGGVDVQARRAGGGLGEHAEPGEGRVAHLVHRLPRRARGVRRDDEHQAEALARVAFERHRRVWVGGHPGEVVQRVHRHRRAAQVDAGGGGEAGLQPHAIAAVHEAGRRDDGPLEGLVVVVALGHLLVEHDRAAAQPLGAVLAHLELVRARRCPPVDGAGLVAGHVLAQAVELARAEAHRLGEQVASEDPVAELGHRQLERPRGDEDLVDAGHLADRAGEAEQVVAHGHQRADVQHPAPLGRDAVAGAALAAAADRRHGHARRAVVAHRLDELEAGSPVERARRAVGADQHVDAAGVAGGEHLGPDPAPHRHPRPAQRDREPAGDRGDAERGGEEVQLQHAEDAPDQSGGDRTHQHDPTLAGRSCRPDHVSRRGSAARRSRRISFIVPAVRRRRPGSRRRHRRDRGGRRARRAASAGG